MEGQHEGLQVGVHAIGDAAIEQAIGTWEKVADKVGMDDVRNLGHRIEHFECASDDHIARAARLGLRASVQPAFDRLWGGPDGLYAQRMGWDRAQGHEPVRFDAEREPDDRRRIRLDRHADGSLLAAGLTPRAPPRKTKVWARSKPCACTRWVRTPSPAGRDWRGPWSRGLRPTWCGWTATPGRWTLPRLLDTQVLGTWVEGSPRMARSRGGDVMKRTTPFIRPVGRLHIDHDAVAECRELAAEIAAPIEDLARTHTTVSIQRALLRLAGVDGVVGEGAEGVPIPNLVVDKIAEHVGLERGVAIPFFHTVESGCGDIQSEAERIASGERIPEWPEDFDLEIAMERAKREAEVAIDRVAGATQSRAEAIARTGEADKPWFYEIVATGNIHEDIPQAQAAAREGCDVVAVIRSTGQSLIDYVPYGATTDGFAGTFATQENFRLMRAALDEVSAELGRYIRLTNYASGLCMPEIAVMAATERLDMMLNDCMYGIIFRDINMQRTFVDQHFSRMIHALAGIIINTGEDNYLTTADAVDSAHTVLASQFLNERLALHGRAAGGADGAGPRVRDRPGATRADHARDRPCPADPRVLPRCSAEVHAADETHDGQRLPGLPLRRDVQPGGSPDRAGHHPARDDDRGRAHAVPLGPGSGAREREPTYSEVRAHLQARCDSSPEVRSSDAQARSSRSAARCSARSPTSGCSPRSKQGCSPTRCVPALGAADSTGSSRSERVLRSIRRATRRSRRGEGLMTAIRPYGDATDDGMVQLSFTLPIAAGELASRSALELARTMGFTRAQVVHMKAMGPDFTFFVVYGATEHSVDPSAIEVAERDFPDLSYQEVNRLIQKRLNRRLVVVGACTGTDAHTVGFDAILSMKGFAGDHGLEYFTGFEVVNMGAQVAPEDVARGRRQQSCRCRAHLPGRDAARRSHPPPERGSRCARGSRASATAFCLIGGGPRFNPDQAGELGYDRIFGRGTKPSEVASYLAWAMNQRSDVA